MPRATENAAIKTSGNSTQELPKKPVDIVPLPLAKGARVIDIVLIAYGRSFEHPCKIRIVRWLIRWMAPRRINVRHAGGAIVAIDPQDYIGRAIFMTGVYEPESLALAMRTMAAEPGLFIDVGANFGWYTCAVASLAGSTVISIEPDSENCSSLRTNIAFNRFRNVIVFNGAVGSNSALLSMSRRSSPNSGTVAVTTGGAAKSGDQYWVAATSLDLLFKTLVRPPTRPVLLKMDVEGFEPQVLAGLDFDGPFRPKNILIECDRTFCREAWGSLEKFAAYFTDRGYELFDVFGRPFATDRPLPEENVWARDRNQAP